MNNQHGRTMLAGTLAFLCGLPIAFANPNHNDPDLALAAHGSGTGAELQAEAASLYAAAVKELRQQLDAMNKGRGAQLSGQAIGQTRAKLIKIQRLGPQIEIYGEPSGTDFSLRYMDAGMAQWNQVVKPYAAAPSSEKFVTSIRLALQKQAPARMKTLERLERMVAEQKWQAAETELYRLFDGLEVGICFLSDQERLSILGPFSEVKAAIDTAMRRMRSQEAAQLLGQSRSEQTPNFVAELRAIQAAAAELGMARQASWNGEQLTGPQLVDKITNRWTEIHVASLRCRALDWAMQPLVQSAGASATSISSDPTSQILQQEYLQFSSAVGDAIVTLIRADAARVSGDEASALYFEYLRSLLPLARLVADVRAVVAWDAALRQLAARNPTLEAEVQAYDAATREMLRWRARTAASLANAHSATFPTLDKHYYDATISKAPFVGLFPERPDGQLAPRLLAAAPAIMTVATPRLLGKQATVFDVVRVSPTSTSSIGRYRARTYATVPAGLDLSAEVSALKTDLMVGEKLPALILAAANSVHSAERGQLASVGGEIVGHHLEALITRFAALPMAASVIVPLGSLPVEDINQRLLPQMAMRFDVKPAWVQHEHFYIHFLPN